MKRTHADKIHDLLFAGDSVCGHEARKFWGIGQLPGVMRDLKRRGVVWSSTKCKRRHDDKPGRKDKPCGESRYFIKKACDVERLNEEPMPLFGDLPDGAIYFAETESLPELIKIGWCKDGRVKNRCKRLSTGLPYELRPIAQIRHVDKEHETMVHRRFRGLKHDGSGGDEWFRRAPEIDAYIRERAEVL